MGTKPTLRAEFQMSAIEVETDEGRALINFRGSLACVGAASAKKLSSGSRQRVNHSALLQAAASNSNLRWLHDPATKSKTPQSSDCGVLVFVGFPCFWRAARSAIVPNSPYNVACIGGAAVCRIAIVRQNADLEARRCHDRAELTHA